MREWAQFTSSQQGDGSYAVAVAGPLLVGSVGMVDDDLRDLAGRIGTIDLSGVSAIDTVGAWLIWRLANEHDASISGASKQAERLITAVGGRVAPAAHTPAQPSGPRDLSDLLERVGKVSIAYWHGTVELLGFLGALLVTAAQTVREPRRFRVVSFVRQIELVGVRALPIIGLMSFLIGIVIAQQGAVQLRQFGAEIFTVNLTCRLSLRELGILMTAIMFAGRSGSSFAAQIGTMKLTEEVDAMRTIGVSPMEALVLPRIAASVVIMPLLGFYAAMLSIVGGAFISMFFLDIPFVTFLGRIKEVVPTYDLWVGLIKGPVFGLIVGLAGCYQGMRVHGNSEDVGLKTTVAVVQAIFAVIVLDAFFAVFFSEVGWG